MITPLNVFISYAHEDEAHRETLGKHLSALVREGLISIWHDRQITGGREWAGVIDQKLKGAEIVLLLISADFLDSDYCNDEELTEAIRMHDAKQARVVPVILRSCDWEKSQFARFNALPPDGLPVVEAEHPDQRFKAVAKGLRAIVAELRTNSEGISGKSPAQAQQAEPPAAAAKLPSESQPAAWETAKESETPHTEPATRKPRTITIGKISLLGIIEIGPFEIPLPTYVGALRGVIVILLLSGIVGGGIYFFAVRGPLAAARDAMRMAGYDAALESLRAVPGWVAKWPEVTALRNKAELGTRFHADRQDWVTLRRDLRRLRNASPDDVDLMVLDATLALKDQNYDKASKMLANAVNADPKNAQAWFLLGLERDLADDVKKAEEHYSKAVEAAPDSPPYRNNIARLLLNRGKVAEAIQEYKKISQFPLARVEQALGHWAKAQIREAGDAQRDALKMLDDKDLQVQFYNRVNWMFQLAIIPSDNRVQLNNLEDKKCYVLLGESASSRLAGKTEDPFPPEACNNPPIEVSKLLADDLCRFVDLPQPSLAAAAGRLRGALGQPEICPAPVPQPESAPSGKIS